MPGIFLLITLIFPPQAPVQDWLAVKDVPEAIRLCTETRDFLKAGRDFVVCEVFIGDPETHSFVRLKVIL